MIQIGPRVKIFVATESVDFRKAFRGLSGLVRTLLKKDPLSGHLFVFRNKRGSAVKVICFDGRACWTMQAKFAKGRLSWWPSVSEIQASELLSLLSQSSQLETTAPFRDLS